MDCKIDIAKILLRILQYNIVTTTTQYDSINEIIIIKFDMLKLSIFIITFLL